LIIQVHPFIVGVSSYADPVGAFLTLLSVDERDLQFLPGSDRLSQSFAAVNESVRLLACALDPDTVWMARRSSLSWSPSFLVDAPAADRVFSGSSIKRGHTRSVISLTYFSFS